MNISVTTSGQVATIQMSGRFDYHVQNAFKGAYTPLLQNPIVSDIEINLSGVDYLDSSALGMLLMLRDRVQVVNKNIVICKPSQTVAQILDIASFTKLFTIT